MANNLDVRPIIIDTPGAGILTTRPLRVKGISWFAPSAIAGNIAEVRDQFDNLKWTSVASGANYKESDYIHDEILWNGLKVPILQSGTLLIELW